MTTRYLLSCLPFLLAGCGEPADRLTDEEAAAVQQANIEAPQPIDVPAPIQAAPPPAAISSYKALGTEPGWTLTVTPKAIAYEGDYGAVTINEATPPRFRPGPGRYTGTRLQVTIATGPCSDGMSDHHYRDTVTVVADGKTASGCGGGIVASPAPKAEPDEPPPSNTI